jgi:hypothetical protein
LLSDPIQRRPRLRHLRKKVVEQPLPLPQRPLPLPRRTIKRVHCPFQAASL